jgi:hypothetical protein
MELAAELPTPVISRLLGIHQQTAEPLAPRSGNISSGIRC